MSTKTTRREFVKRMSFTTVGGITAPWALNLAAIADAAAQTAPSDYKALVCIFMTGGNDCHNTLIPVDSTGYQQYSSKRGSLSIVQSSLSSSTLSPTTAVNDGRTLALNSAMSPLVPLFNSSRKLAIVPNLGPLTVPLTQAEYINKSKAEPAQLFSHNDQQVTWMAGAPEGATTGWGGRMGDLFASSNGQTPLTSISISGNQVFLSGNSIAQYQLLPQGVVALKPATTDMFGSQSVTTAYNQLSNFSSSEVFANEYNKVLQRSIAVGKTLSTALAGNSALKTVFSSNDNPLSSQLSMVAKTIQARSALGQKRQIFFVSLGGFDTHSNQLQTHGLLIAQVAEAMSEFYNATVEMGIANQVTTFTASDFGRTLANNGDGTDHGWGGHHFVLGGAVNGGKVYGNFPSLASNSPDMAEVTTGRLLPTTSVDQYASTLATWMGVSNAEQEQTVIPNIKNFSQRNLGFMA
jgi:uncharacterized protein (DUF1501 family)